MDPDELELLTEAERAGMEDDDEEEGQEAGTEEEDEDEGEGQTGDEPKSDPKPAESDPKPADPAPGRDDGAPASDPEPAPVNIPPLKADDTTEAKARLEAIDGERDSLAQQFDDGDLTAKEYAAALKKLDTEARDLDWTVRKASLAAEMAEQARTQAWFGAVNEFFAEHPEIKKNQTLLRSFDMVVRDVNGEQANESLTDRARLKLAYERWSADLGLTPAKPAAKPAEAPPKATKPAKELPPSLAKVPAAAAQETDDGRFAALDQLATRDPIAFEDRLAKMSEADQEAYLQSR